MQFPGGVPGVPGQMGGMQGVPTQAQLQQLQQAQAFQIQQMQAAMAANPQLKAQFAQQVRSADRGPPAGVHSPPPALPKRRWCSPGRSCTLS